MFEEDAVARMEELGHRFFVFVNAETERVAILYRRDDGDFGLIEPVVGGDYTKRGAARTEHAGASLVGAPLRLHRAAVGTARSGTTVARRTMPRMLPDGRRLGAHLPLGAGMVKAVDRAHEIGADALQIFADNPTAWRRRAEPPSRAAGLRELPDRARHRADRHPRLVPGQPGRARGGLLRALGRAARQRAASGARVPAAASSTSTSDRIAAPASRPGRAAWPTGSPSTLAEVDDGPDAAMVVLENSPGSGFGLGTDVAELAGDRSTPPLARGVAVASGSGFCLDTAHAWAAGIDVGEPAAIDAFLDDFDDRIGLERLVMLHLNDSKSERGSRLDRHEHLGAGRIGVRRPAPPAPPPGAGPRDLLPRDARAWTRATTRSTSHGPTTSPPAARCRRSLQKR